MDIYGSTNSPGAIYATSRIGVIPAMEEYPVLRKPWPSCAYTHRSIEAAINLTKRVNFNPGEIISGEISVPAPYARVAGFRTPVDVNQARFSLGYCVASTLIDGFFGMDSLTMLALQRPEARNLQAKLNIDAYDAGVGLEDMSAKAPDTVTLAFSSDVILSETIADVKGGMNKPMTEEEIQQKFHSCAGSVALSDFLLTASDNQTLRVSGLSQKYAG